MNGSAVTITARGRAELLQVDAPAGPPGDGEISGATLATAVSPGTEINWAFLGSGFPSTPGYAAVFRVDEVGPATPGVAPGDRYFVMGPHRSFQRCRAADAIRVPDGLDPADATLARLIGVSMSTLTTTAARPPQLVLVTGLGIVGHLAARLFGSCGYDVMGWDPSASRRAAAEAAGIPCLSAPPADTPRVSGRVALVLECSGHEGAAIEGCRVVQKRGEVVLLGVPWAARSAESAFALTHAIFHQYAVVRSGWEWEVPFHPAEFRSGSIIGNLAGALRWLAERRISSAGIYRLAPPGTAQEVYTALADQSWPALTAVFDWRD